MHIYIELCRTENLATNYGTDGEGESVIFCLMLINLQSINEFS